MSPRLLLSPTHLTEHKRNMGVSGGKHHPGRGSERSEDGDHLLWRELDLGSSTGEGRKHLDDHLESAWETDIWGSLGTKGPGGT